MLVAFCASLSVMFGMWTVVFYREYHKKKHRLTDTVRKFLGDQPQHTNWAIQLGYWFDNTVLAKRIELKLQRMHFSLRPSEYCMFLLLTAVLLIWFLHTFLSIAVFPGFLLAGTLLYVGRQVIFRVLKQRRNERFLRQLPEVCRLLGNSLRAGMALNQGMALLAKDMPQPASLEFQLVYKEMLLGVEFEKALEAFRCRINSRDCDLFVGAILIQRKTGGNLAQVLEDIAMTMEERFFLQQTVKTATAEAKYTAFLLPLLPTLLMIMMNIMIEGFLRPIFTIPGLVLVGVFLAVQLTAYIAVKKITGFQV